MNLKKGRINNINKKLIAGALTMTLVMVPMSGCARPNSIDEHYTGFEYTVSEDGRYEATGKIDYQLLKDYEFVVIENKTYDVTEYYICKYIFVNNSDFDFANFGDQVYTDIYNNQIIFKIMHPVDNAKRMIYSEKLENYFYATNNIKKNYTVEDVELIFSEMKENYLKQNGKQKVKEK